MTLGTALLTKTTQIIFQLIYSTFYIIKYSPYFSDAKLKLCVLTDIPKLIEIQRTGK